MMAQRRYSLFMLFRLLPFLLLACQSSVQCAFGRQELFVETIVERDEGSIR